MKKTGRHERRPVLVSRLLSSTAGTAILIIHIGFSFVVTLVFGGIAGDDVFVNSCVFKVACDVISYCTSTSICVTFFLLIRNLK